MDVTGPMTIAGFLPLTGEPDIVTCLALAVERGDRVVVPRTLPGHEIEWVSWHPSAPLRPDRHGLRAPVGPAVADALLDGRVVVLVPALAVDWGGARVGHGAGYYDRALSTAPRWPDGPLRVAVVHPEELVTAPLPMEQHDEPMDAVVTAAGWMQLTGF
jgi:5-formyltetrahydrofolate cyclo-ligase